MQKASSKLLLSLVTISMLFSFAPFIFAQELPEAPKDLNGAEGILKSVLRSIERAFNEAVNFIKALYYKYIQAWAKAIWQRIYAILGKEVEKRKPEVQKEFNKEVEELKEEAIKEAPSLWQRFKDLIY